MTLEGGFGISLEQDRVALAAEAFIYGYLLVAELSRGRGG
jgi:hypothetical protein